MIEVKELSKRYGDVEAVKGVSFSVGKDQVLGFLGPNGAGKTTIMKILTGYHYPTGGAAFVDGLSVQEQSVAVKARIGYLPEGVPLYGDLTVDEYLGFVADARLVAKGERAAKIGAAVEACGLGGMRGRRIETLSKGYKQRTGLAGAIVHDPPILILDEPTTGLDPNQIIEIRNLIKELGKRKTVILSTHILQEVEAVCNQVLILNEGRIAAQGTPEEIAVSMKGGVSWRLRLKAGDGAGGKPAVESALAAFAAEHQGENQTVEEKGGGIFEAALLARNTGARYTGEGAAGEDLFAEELFDWAVARDYKILSMSRQRLTLEDIFVQLTHDDRYGG
ncbi:MAG: ATP-binding cassette domain-containing protein [Spirochaetaceae bacterium]|jgi:ABC-2 type transport system ATP-binding protein|nr:ATP-binding cassette domain-containing protein [Spirochaetaceae bacterium]